MNKNSEMEGKPGPPSFWTSFLGRTETWLWVVGLLRTLEMRITQNGGRGGQLGSCDESLSWGVVCLRKITNEVEP